MPREGSASGRAAEKGSGDVMKRARICHEMGREMSWKGSGNVLLVLVSSPRPKAMEPSLNEESGNVKGRFGRWQGRRERVGRCHEKNRDMSRIVSGDDIERVGKCRTCIW